MHCIDVSTFCNVGSGGGGAFLGTCDDGNRSPASMYVGCFMVDHMGA